jgi:NAD(P)-dependent dehydrogenase (short-subunit alcohol dehydrogenase family)
MFSVRDKVVLITGGSSGIGFMIASGFVQNGAKVYIASRKKKQCDEAAEKLNRDGCGKCISVPADVSTESGCKKLAEELAVREKALHVLIHSAGTNWAEPFETYPDSAWDKLYALNVKAVFHLTRACLNLLKTAATDSDPARVIIIGSIFGSRINDFETYAYGATKAAVYNLSNMLAFKLAPFKITVNTLTCGLFESKMTAETVRRFGVFMIENTPMKRIGTAEVIKRQFDTLILVNS